MSYTIVALADIHAAETNPIHCPKRRSTIAEILLLRAVQRINRYIKPNATVILGDLLDAGSSPQAPESRQRLREITDLLQSPTVIIPGNHDGDVESFYQQFPRPAEMVDIAGVRLLPFLDPEEPRFNARRTKADLVRITAARVGFDGPIIALQHVPLLPPGRGSSPYHLTNASEVIDAMRRAGITMAISGHYHEGEVLLQEDAGAFVVVPALCETPFAFLEITLEDERMTVTRHELCMPQELALIDCHTHTQFAYCHENMDCQLSVQLAQEFGLADICFTEHSGQLYFNAETYWGGSFLPEGINFASGRHLRMPEYLDAARSLCPPARLGLEVDCDYRGHAVITAEDRTQVPLLIGAIHQLAELTHPTPDLERAADEFLAKLQSFAHSGIQVLAHPFRVFRRAHLPVPERLFAPTISLLREQGIAAEINFHTNEPSIEFTRQCLNAGVPLTFGSDAHNRYEIGEFAPHLALLQECGVTSSCLHNVLSPLAMQAKFD